jgi:hypothetical protein
MLLFRSEEEVADWQKGSAEGEGVTIPASQLQRLAAAWYGNHLKPAWQPRTPAQSQAVLDQAGLSGPFWRLPSPR